MLNAHLNKILCIQFGSDMHNFRIVVDCTTIDIMHYKDILESKYLIGHNLKFDLQFLYNHKIVPRRVYDTMIVEQLLHLGYPTGTISYSLFSVAYRRLDKYIDKEVRGQIIWRGLDDDVIVYAANDVKYLEEVAKSQKKDLIKHNMVKGAIIECNVVPAMAYLEWCGIKLDEKKWKEKMDKDSANLSSSKELLNQFIINKSLEDDRFKSFVKYPIMGDLFEDIDLDTPECTINWSSSRQVVEIAKLLGFDTTVQDKKTGENKDSVIEKHLKGQKGICDEFIKLYLDYQGYAKVVSSFGQTHLDSINPITGRLHTTYKQLGTSTGRMSSGGQDDKELAIYKKLPKGSCKHLNMQQLPHDPETRACFVAEEGNMFCSVDYDGMEARLGAIIYEEKAFIDEFLYGSGDMHSVWAKHAFSEDLKDIDTKDIKKVRPDLRQKAKAYGFAILFGSDGTAIAQNLGIPVEEARNTVSNILKGLSGFNKFKVEKSKEVEKLGYVLIHPETGHKQFWYGHQDWLDTKKKFNKEFWEEYKLNHKGKDTYVSDMVSQHFREASKYHRAALNSVTQGGGAIVMKLASTYIFNWIVDNDYFGVIKSVNITHDEYNSEFPKELEAIYPKFISDTLQKAGAELYDTLPLTASASVGKHWIH